jgi:hypothetical protein
LLVVSGHGALAWHWAFGIGHWAMGIGNNSFPFAFTLYPFPFPLSPSSKSPFPPLQKAFPHLLTVVSTREQQLPLTQLGVILPEMIMLKDLPVPL